MARRATHAGPRGLLLGAAAAACIACGTGRDGLALPASAAAEADVPAAVDPNVPVPPGPPGSIAAMAPADAVARLDYFAAMGSGPAQFRTFCRNRFADKFSRVYCAGPTPPAITSMADMLDLFGIRAGIAAGQPGPDVQVANNGLQRINGFNFAITHQSASLVSRDTSVLNPRAIVFDSNPPFIAFGFARGGGLVEVAAQDPNTRAVNFFLLRYRRACDLTDSCTPADRFMEQNESGWVTLDAYTGNDDLRNTVRQCDTCHRPDGYDYNMAQGGAAILRMTQLQNPWVNWFRSDRGGRQLVAEFCQTHAGEAYAGIPYVYLCDPPAVVASILAGTGQGRAPQLTGGNPQRLENDMVRPGKFETNAHVINFQGSQVNNDDPNFVGPPNALWTGFFSQVLAGKLAHIPAYEVDVFDPPRVRAAMAAYRAVAAGKADPSSLPDMTAALIRDDQLPWVSHVGISVTPSTGANATAIEIVNQQCATCHAGVFVGAGSRDNFVVADFPARLSDEMRRKVANRICRPNSSVYLMPPQMFATFTPANRSLVLIALGLPPLCPDERWFPGQAL